MTIEYKDSKRIVGLSSEALVAHLKFNDNVTDSAGSNNGTVTGTTTYVTGKVGKAFSFNGSSYITLANESNFDFERTDSFSVSLWLKTGTEQDIKMLVGKSELNTLGWHIWMRQGAAGDDNGDIHFNLVNTNATNEIETRIQVLPMFDDTWHHLVWTYDGTSDVSGVHGYWDGVEISKGSGTNNLTSSILNNLPVSIGDTPNGGGRDYTGSMDDVRIYSRELDQSEVTMIYNSGNGTEENKPTDVQDNSLFVEKDTARRYWLTPQTVDTEEAFSFTTTDTVNALWGNRIYGMKLLSGHSGLNKYIKKIKTYHPTNPTGSRLTTGTLYHVILDSSGTEIARSAGVSASSVSNNSWAETTLSTPVKLEENYTVGVTISTGSGSSYLGTAVNNNSSSPTNTTRYYKDESGTESTSTSETILMVFDSDPATGISIPATWTKQNPELPTVSGLYVHYDATDVNSITKDSNNRISQWNDKSGGERHLTQATSGNQPLWISSDEAGNPVIDFSDDRYMSDTWSAQSLPNTIFIVARLPVATGTRTNIISGSGSNAQSVFGDGSNTWKYAAGSAQGGTKTGIEDTWQYIYALYGDDYTFEIGGELITGTACGSDTWIGMTVGASSAVSQFGNMKIGEIIGYNVAVKGADKTAIINYLKEKWERT